jgi:hypothetical protein
MNADFITAMAGVLAGGAWLRWAIVPLLIAYQVGRHVERIRNARKAPAR